MPPLVHNIIGDNMHIVLYIFIFFAKVIENALATLRLIVVANGKKWLGAFLNFAIALIWTVSTAFVVVNISEDPFKIVAFALGSFLGSYVGSLIEEKMAMGSNLLIIAVQPNCSKQIDEKLNRLEYRTFLLKSSNNDILLVTVPRKKRPKVLKIVYELDKKAIVISEVAKLLVNKSAEDNQL